MADTAPFAKLVPGFDFLQSLVKNAGAALPTMGQWVAPTLNPEELEKRIGELRTVQFWLEQNARMLGATVQALEVQRMTLSTLKTMNVQMGDLRDSLTAKPPATPAPAPAAAFPKPQPAAAAESSSEPSGEPTDGPAPPTVDPMQWWNALTQQFTQLAANAMKENGSDLGRSMAGAMAMPGAPATAPRGKAKAPAKKTARSAAARKRGSAGR